jgi:hypothetical protein
MGQTGWKLVRDKYSQVNHFLALDKTYANLATKLKRDVSLHQSKPLRIAFIGGRGIVGKYSGVETCCEHVGRRLARRGHRVTTYCRSYFTPDITEHDGIRIVRLPTIRTKHLAHCCTRS